MSSSLTTNTKVGNATITVTGFCSEEAQTTAKVIIKNLLIRHISGDYDVDLSPNKSEYVTLEKGVRK